MTGSGTELSTSILNDITQIITAIGVILTAASSILNRLKLDKVERKMDTAVVVATETRNEAVNASRSASDKLDKIHADTVGRVEEVKQVVKEVREVAEAVNGQVVEKVHEAGVEAGKALAHNGTPR